MDFIKYFPHLLLVAYIGLTFFLSIKGMRKTVGLKSFSIGSGDMPAWVVGVTLASSIASSATFIINPGFIYTHGVSAVLHYGPSAFLGILAAFFLLGKKFRESGLKTGAITLPNWIFQRFGHRSLSVLFAILNLLSVTFVVLILVGSSILLSSMFGIDQKTSLVLVLLFVFSYVLMGGTYAHAYTNTFQGIMMGVISLSLFGIGMYFYGGELTGEFLNNQSAYWNIINTESNLYYDVFSVFVSGFLITFALMLQPHIISKFLYIKNEKDMKPFLNVTIIVGAIFTLILFVGFFAKLSGFAIPRQDAALVVFINNFFTSTFGVMFKGFVFVSLLAAGMSTLDGILVSLSSMIVTDLFIPMFKKDDIQGLKISRYVLVAIGLFSLALAWNPPQLVGIFAQKGVYALAVMSVGPVLLGVLTDRKIANSFLMFLTLAPGILHFFILEYYSVQNPSVSAAIAILFSFTIIAGQLIRLKKQKEVLA